jgi:hypothetical protein
MEVVEILRGLGLVLLIPRLGLGRIISEKRSKLKYYSKLENPSKVLYDVEFYVLRRKSNSFE